MKQIPNLFTLLNLFFGCLAILFVLQNGLTVVYSEEGDRILRMPPEIWMASLFIGLAALVDFFDGFVARLFKVASEKGKQLDSLADVVSFGVAPGMILFQFLKLSYGQQADGLETSMNYLIPAFIFPCATAYRLAKFNVDSSQQYVFKGVPSPVAGLLIASLPLIYWNTDNDSIYVLLQNKWFLYGITLIVSYLMVSNLPMISLKLKKLDFRSSQPQIILLIIALVSALVLKWLAVPVVFLFYILLSLIYKNRVS
jgi:CDP-diacylglycerol--serine O-phosphatidyltransferase